jgi:hypothetical protein
MVELLGRLEWLVWVVGLWSVFHAWFIEPDEIRKGEEQRRKSEECYARIQREWEAENAKWKAGLWYSNQDKEPCND